MAEHGESPEELIAAERRRRRSFGSAERAARKSRAMRARSKEVSRLRKQAVKPGEEGPGSPVKLSARRKKQTNPILRVLGIR